MDIVLAWPLENRDENAFGRARGFRQNARSFGREASFFFPVDGDPELDAWARGLAEGRDSDASLSCIVKPPRAWDPSYNMNRILLAGAGSRIIMTDGDIACVPARLAAGAGEASGADGGGVTRPGPVYEGPRYSVPTTVYPDRAAALSAVKGEDIDVVGVHLAYLGADTGSLFPDSDAPPGFVFMTSPGTYGDSGFALARGVLSLEGAPRDAVMANGYERCRLSRETVRVPERDVASPSLQFLGMQAGYDAREYAPPFLPVGRNGDGLYALLARVLLPGSLTAYPAFALYHEPAEPRAYDPATLTSFEPKRADLFMSIAIGLCPPPAVTDARARTVELGSRFREASRLSASDLVDLAYGALADAAAAHAENLETLLDRFGGEPSAWARDVGEHLGNVYGFLREPAAVFGPEGSERSASAVRSDLDRFGRFLSVWPELFDRAKATNREGLGPAREIGNYGLGD